MCLRNTRSMGFVETGMNSNESNNTKAVKLIENIQVFTAKINCSKF